MARQLFLLLALCAALARPAAAADKWTELPPPPPLPEPLLEGRIAHDGAKIWFATFGSGPPVLLLHGAMGSANNFGNQIPALTAAGYRVIAIDSRGQGRSTRDGRPFTYELMESDVVAVMDALGVKRAAVVGWSDGGILGLVMAMKHPQRVSRVFAFGANMDAKAVNPNAISLPIVQRIFAHVTADYARLSPTPVEVGRMMADIGKMLETEPNYGAAELSKIRGPKVAIADGDHEEIILPEHVRFLAATIPGAKLVILKDVGHAALWQDPEQFNAAMLAFLKGH